MKSKTAKTWVTLALLSLASAAISAPGTPIGGIIVKGGKNPGGQMRAMATTDAAGKFRIRFVEGGDYMLEFDVTASKESAERMKAGFQVDYLIERADVMAAGKATETNASRHTPFHNRLEQRRTVVRIPDGGGELRGELQALAADEDAAARGITESGVSARPPKSKGGIKK